MQANPLKEFACSVRRGFALQPQLDDTGSSLDLRNLLAFDLFAGGVAGLAYSAAAGERPVNCLMYAAAGGIAGIAHAIIATEIPETLPDIKELVRGVIQDLTAADSRTIQEPLDNNVDYRVLKQMLDEVYSKISAARA